MEIIENLTETQLHNTAETLVILQNKYATLEHAIV